MYISLKFFILVYHIFSWYFLLNTIFKCTLGPTHLSVSQLFAILFLINNSMGPMNFEHMWYHTLDLGNWLVITLLETKMNLPTSVVSNFQKLPIYRWIFEGPTLVMLKSSMNSSCVTLVQGKTAIVCWCVYQPCPVQKTEFHSSPLHSLILK